MEVIYKIQPLTLYYNISFCQYISMRDFNTSVMCLFLGVASVASGGVIAALQSAGAAGVGLGVKAAGAAAGAAAGYAATKGSCDKPGAKQC